jgi:hypothetical protein
MVLRSVRRPGELCPLSTTQIYRSKIVILDAQLMPGWVRATRRCPLSMSFRIGTDAMWLAEFRQIAVAFCESFVIQCHPLPIVRKFSEKFARYCVSGFFCQPSTFRDAFPSFFNDVWHDYPMSTMRGNSRRMNKFNGSMKYKLAFEIAVNFPFHQSQTRLSLDSLAAKSSTKSKLAW